jgi:hypothetical protein
MWAHGYIVGPNLEEMEAFPAARKHMPMGDRIQ